MRSPLNVERMDAACQALIGAHDFASFRTHRSQDAPGRATERRVVAASWMVDAVHPELLHFEIEADGFLRHMVRAIVGSAILVGEGKLATRGLAEMIERRSRPAAGPTAPACGLTLLAVNY